MSENEFSFKNYFVPLTNAKAITWIVIIGIIVYANMLINGFVWDDIGQIVTNGDIHSLSNIWSFFFSTHDIHGNLIKIQAIYYRPLMAAVFTIAYVLFGPNPFFFHLFSLILHIGISLLIFFLFKRFFRQKIAFFLAVIFLIHPLNSEAVDYISAYNDLMYAFFGMLTVLLLYKKVISYRRLIAISICLFLSLLSKEQGFLFVPTLLVFTYLYQKKYLVRITISSIIVVVLYVILRTTFYVGVPSDQILGFSPYLHMSLLEHLINIPKLFFYYIFNFFYPSQLAIAQHWSVQKLTLSDFFIPLVILISFVGLNLTFLIRTFGNKEKFSSVLFFSIWFWVGIGLYLQFIPLDMTVADRWFYFPMIGLLGLIGVSLQDLCINKNYKSTVINIVIICVVIFSIRTIVRNTNWFNEKTLYTHDITIAKQSFDLENQLGNVYFQEHNNKEAIIHYRRSIDLWNCSDALNNLGYLDQSTGNIQAAEQNYLQSVQCSGGYKDYGNLILLLVKLHKLDLAEKYTKEAIVKYPNGAGLYFILGVIDDKKGNKQEALKNLGIGYQLSHDPQIAQAYIEVQNNKPVDLPL
ncbi:MAG TPA: hypothetical protein VND99_02220 [Candidatus Acidoferrales bacterium]|nr:hypothetical protein [Candidatus Acidoferrales bacterium]